MHNITVLNTDKAPKPVGSYSQAIRFKDIIFISGQIGIDPETGDFVNDIEKQTSQVMKNLEGILKSEGLKFENIVKTTIFTVNINYYQTVNKIYSQYFKKNPPARSFIEVSKLPKGVDIEIEAIVAC